MKIVVLTICFLLAVGLLTYCLILLWSDDNDDELIHIDFDVEIEGEYEPTEAEKDRDYYIDSIH